MSQTKYKTITITLDLSEFNPSLNTLDDLTTILVRKTSRKINRTIKSHNRFKPYKVNIDGISIKTFPNKI